MKVTYRAVKREEEAATLKMWVDVFDVEAEFFQTLLDAEPRRRLAQTQVAVDESGRIVSSLQYFVRRIRGLDGKVHRVGGIANVATIPEARKQGHSGRLLERAKREMARQGCEWSWLFSGVNPHYENHGWRAIPKPYRKGAVAPEAPVTEGYRVERVCGERLVALLPAFARIQLAFNERRPCTTVRSKKDWLVPIHYQMASHHHMIVTAAFAGRRRTPCAYLAVGPEAEKHYLAEVAVLPGHEPAVAALFDDARRDAQAHDVKEVVALLPSEPIIDDALPRIVEVKDVETWYSSMVLPLVPTVTDGYLDRLYGAPGAHYWRLDGF